MAAPILDYNAQIIKGGVDLSLSGVGTPNVTASYGDYGGIGEPMSLKATCSVTVSYSNVNWVINNDNSVTVTGNIEPVILTRTASGTASSNQQLITAYFNGQQVFQTTVDTASSGSYNLNIPSTFSVTIPPSLNPQSAYPAAVHIINDNIQSTTQPDDFAVGLLITNPNPPSYRPGLVYDNTITGQSHNRTAGTAKIYNGSDWVVMTTINGGTGSGDPPYIRHQSGWINMRKIGENQNN